MKGFAVLAPFAAAVIGCATAACATTTPAPTNPETATPLLSTGMTTSADATAANGPSTSGTATAATDPTPAPAAEPPPAEPIPTACVGEQAIKDAAACLPPGNFVTKMCSATYADLALAMFAKGTPWTRVWLAGDVEAWNASGGFTSRSTVAFDEEVIVLSRHAAATTGGIVMSGNTSFDVLRWDGSCVSVLEGELTTKRPPAPKPSPIAWNHLEDATKQALLASSKVKSAHDALAKACARDHQACDHAETDLARAVAHAVRSGSATLPTPTRRP